MSLVNIEEKIFDVYQTAWSDAGDGLDRNDPWFIPKDNLSWYVQGRRHWFHIDIAEEFSDIEDSVMFMNRVHFPDLYKGV